MTQAAATVVASSLVIWVGYCVQLPLLGILGGIGTPLLTCAAWWMIERSALHSTPRVPPNHSPDAAALDPDR